MNPLKEARKLPSIHIDVKGKVKQIPDPCPCQRTICRGRPR